MNEERIRLFTNFSHELRTPLTLISNPLEDLMQNNAFSSEVKKVLTLMQKNTKKMLLLVNNLMDIQKIRCAQNGLAERALQSICLHKRIIRYV